MQSKERNTRGADAVNHPSAAEWMAFLYLELPPEQRRELGVHLAECVACSVQVKNWRAGMVVLDEWQLPVVHRAKQWWQPVTALKWAAAAIMVLTVSFALGRQTSSASNEIAALKASVAQLAENMERERALNASYAADAGNREVIRLLADYAKSNEENRLEDRQTVALALREIDSRVRKLRTELETVAVNTEDSFQQTQNGLTQLAAYTVPLPNHVPGLSTPETKNQ